MLTTFDVAWLRLCFELSSLPHVHHLFFWQRTIAAVIRVALAKSESWVIYKRARQETCAWDFCHTTTTYTPSILHLTLTYCNSLVINTLLSVRCCKFHLHTTYTTHMLPHGTSTGGWYLGIGEQKSLLLRQIILRPCGESRCIRQNRLRGSGVWCVRCMQGSVRYFELILHSWNICISTCYIQKV